MSKQEQKYGYYSAKADAAYGTVMYFDEHGDVIILTSIGSTPLPIDSGYLWEDAKPCGKVGECIRSNERNGWKYSDNDNELGHKAHQRSSAVELDWGTHEWHVD